MELKVWVEGIQRIVCGVTEHTTCQDVVYALAHATGKTGRFTLIERWRSNERLLSPVEHPLKVLLKWGEYSSDVQFVLQRSPLESKSTRSGGSSSSSRASRQPSEGGIRNGQGCKDIKKSLTFSGGHHSNMSPFRDKEVRRDNVGVVRGVPHRWPAEPAADSKGMLGGPLKKVPEDFVKPSHEVYSNGGSEEKTKKKGCQLQPPPYREPPRPTSPAERDSPCKDIRPKELPPYRNPPPPPPPTLYRASPTHRGNYLRNDCTSPSPSSLYVASRRQDSPGVTAVKSPRRESEETKSPNRMRNLPKTLECKPQVSGESENAANNTNNNQDLTQCDSQCRELLLLIKHQQDKLNIQQTELTKCNEEISYRESKSQEQQRKMEYISKEMEQLEKTCRQNEDQARVFGHVQAEHEVAKQQEKTLKSELTLLRSKLANSETELLQHKNKIRLLTDQVQSEQRLLHQDDDKCKMKEGCLLDELERLGRECEQAKMESEAVTGACERLLKEEKTLESEVSKKKEEVELLVQQMKQVNLQSLSIAPSDELRCLLDGPHKAGSSRKIVGSPRQLENAIPTTKNPLGVWV